MHCNKYEAILTTTKHSSAAYILGEQGVQQVVYVPATDYRAFKYIPSTLAVLLALVPPNKRRPTQSMTKRVALFTKFTAPNKIEDTADCRQQNKE